MQHDEQVPFFARFLECEDYPQVETDVKAGSGTKPTLDLNHTLKYPSDGDEV